MAGELRVALRAIPESHRGAIVMGMALWEGLVGPETCAAIRDDVALNPLPETDASGAEGHDEDTAGAVMYSLACGEAKFLPDSTLPKVPSRA